MRENKVTKSQVSQKIKFLFLLSRIINWTFKNAFNRVIIISLLYSLVLFMIMPFSIFLLIIIIIIPLIFSLNFKRVSENFNLNRLSGFLNMSLKNPDDYWKYSYRLEKGQIAQKLKEEFIAGIVNASKYRRRIKMSTHKWMLYEVVYDNEIQSRFNIKIIKNKKPVKLYTEVLILFSKKEFSEDSMYAYEIAMRKRDSFTVILNRK